MSALMKSFGFGEQLVRAFERSDGVWFSAKDVCAALEIGNSRMAVAGLEDDERDGVSITDAIGRPQEMTIISESGMYALVFKSRKAAAKQFRRWVTAEVLPALRATGRYQIENAANDEPMLDIPSLGTAQDMEKIRIAVLMVRETSRVWGQKAARQMWAHLGFPVPDAELPPPHPAPGEPPVQKEGNVHAWTAACKIFESRREATHIRELRASYEGWCAANGYRTMHPDRFLKSMVMLYGREEHPEMIKVAMKR